MNGFKDGDHIIFLDNKYKHPQELVGIVHGHIPKTGWKGKVINKQGDLYLVEYVSDESTPRTMRLGFKETSLEPDKEFIPEINNNYSIY